MIEDAIFALRLVFVFAALMASAALVGGGLVALVVLPATSLWLIPVGALPFIVGLAVALFIIIRLVRAVASLIEEE